MMFSIIATIITAIILFALGMYSGAYRKLAGIFVKTTRCSIDITDNVLRKFEKEENISNEIRDVFSEIKKMKRSKENDQKISSISYFGICAIAISSLILLLNFEWTTGQLITEWVAGLIPTIEKDTITTFITSISCSGITSGLSMIISQWRKASKYRKEQKINKIKEAARRELSEQELIEIVNEKIKEKDIYNEGTK